MGRRVCHRRVVLVGGAERLKHGDVDVLTAAVGGAVLDGGHGGDPGGDPGDVLGGLAARG
jgi:hypothetical protein